MQRTGARPTGRAALTSAGQQHATALWPIQLAMMDSPVLLSRDHQVLCEPETDQPVAQHHRFVTDDARPDAWLMDSTRSHNHRGHRNLHLPAGPDGEIAEDEILDWLRDVVACRLSAQTVGRNSGALTQPSTLSHRRILFFAMRLAFGMVATVYLAGAALLIIWAGWLLATDDPDGGRHPVGAIMLAVGVACGILGLVSLRSFRRR